jgi:hypothetical protein
MHKSPLFYLGVVLRAGILQLDAGLKESMGKFGGMFESDLAHVGVYMCALILALSGTYVPPGSLDFS